MEVSEEARRMIIGRSLIAADVDKTILSQNEKAEREEFLEMLAPQLVRAASFGAHLAFLTGNSMHELSSRFLGMLIEQLCHTRTRAIVLSRFHFFCNSGGVYAHFSDVDDLTEVFERAEGANNAADVILGALAQETEKGQMAIRPRYVASNYIRLSKIPDEDINRLCDVLKLASDEYYEKLTAQQDRYREEYDLSKISTENSLKKPQLEVRTVQYGDDASPKSATVQITLKPILSFRHAQVPENLVGKDLRQEVVEAIQERLDRRGLRHFVARPGGRSSIDVTLEKLDKAYALEWLIDSLNLQGSPRQGQKLGSNAIYLGDEVIVGGGNDYPVTRIPGLLVFAVNPERELIPFRSQVLVPSAILEGPDATTEVLAKFNICAHRLLKQGFPYNSDARVNTALEEFKREIFGSRIRDKIFDLTSTSRASVEDWQTLHALITLMCRKDKAARQWLSVLIDELDSIMAQVAENYSVLVPPAVGTSHPDW